MFVGLSTCVHMTSSKRTLYYLHVSEICDVLVFSVLILKVPDSGLGSATGYGNGNIYVFLVVFPQKC
jgi:hypothetical protein